MNSKLAKKFASFLKRLPDEKLKNLAKKEDQIKRWHTARGTNNVIAICFEARFSGKDDPIAEWQQQGKVRKLMWEIVWRTVEMYETLWGLVQIGFKDIQTLVKEIGMQFPFYRAFDLFIEIVSFKENLTYAHCLESTYKNSVGENEQRFQLIRKQLWSRLSSEEQRQLQRLTEHLNEKQTWLCTAYAVCLLKSQSNSLVADKVKEFQQKIAQISDLISKIYSDSRKGRLPGGKLKSSLWIDGKRYEGQRYGGVYS